MNEQQDLLPNDRQPAEEVLLTVVVPTFNESDNIDELVNRVSRCLPRGDAEILFIDDSTDDTPNVIELAASNSEIPVRLIHRLAGTRVGGLSGAVTAGLAAAHGRYAIVMDGDLQHPPELLSSLLAVLQQPNADLVVASRYSGTGTASGLAGRWRRQVSKGSTTAARVLFPRRVGGKCTDPMTGFFGLDLRAITLTRLQARGFKILLEILVSHDLQVQEVPFTFAQRHAGVSKASWRRGVEFLSQLLRLRCRAPIVRFAGVGVLGAGLNLAIMALLLSNRLGYLAAATLASEVTIVSNFLLQERMVFHTSTAQRNFWVRCWHSLALNNAELILRIPILTFLVRFLHIGELSAAAIALILAFGGRYLVLSKFTYRRGRPKIARVDHHQAPTLPAVSLNRVMTDPTMEVA